MIKMLTKIYQKILRIYVSTFNIKETNIIFEENASFKVGAILKKEKIDKVLIVTDSVIFKLGLLSKLLDGINKNAIEFVLYSQVQANPVVKNVEDVKELYIKNNCQAIIAIGGGSVIDCAKVAGVIALTNKAVKRYDHMIPFVPKMTKLIAIPTTAGTGSEVTISAIITDEKNHKKMPITDKKLAPDYAILDPMLTIGLPNHITAATGIDALTHAIEAYIGNWKFEVTDDYAIKSVNKILTNLEKAYIDGSNIKARSEVLIGATYGGYAFRTAGVGYVHAIAHRLSELYNVPHGLANAMVLPHVLRYSFDSIYVNLADLYKNAGFGSYDKDDKEIAMDFITRIEKLNENLKIPKHIKEIKQSDIKLIAKRAIHEANTTYPVPMVMTKKEMEAFIESLIK